jgi:hypothetical protein
MPYLFGVDTSTILLKHEGHKLHEAFTVEDNTAYLVVAGDLVTSNAINGTVNGVAISEVIFSGSHANTMALIVTELISHAAILSAELVDTHKIKVIAISNAAPITEITLVTTLGSAQEVWTPTYNQNRLVLGMPVALNIDGTVRPVQAEDLTIEIIGIATIAAIEVEDVTVMMKAFVIIFAEWKVNTSLAGPVTFDNYNGTTGLNEVDDASVDNTNIWGWAFDPGDNGEITRVALI